LLRKIDKKTKIVHNYASIFFEAVVMDSHRSNGILTGRTKTVLEDVLGRKEGQRLKLKESSKNMLRKRAKELIVDLHEAKLILDEKDIPSKRQALLSDKKNKKMFDVLTFIGPNIFITDQDPTDYPPHFYPLIRKEESDLGKNTYTLYCYNYSEDPAVIEKISLDATSSISTSEKLFFDHPEDTFTPMVLSPGERFELLKDIDINIYKKGNCGSFYKFNSLLFGIGFIYLVEKNHCEIDDLKLTEKEVMDDPLFGYKVFLNGREASGIISEKNNFYYFKDYSQAGIYATEPFTYTLRMNIKTRNENGLYPSPVEILSGKSDKLFFTELSKDYTIHTNTLKKSIAKSIERNYSARPFQPFAVKNIIAYVRRSTPENKVAEVLDFSGGWGNRLFAFLLDKYTKKISINDANPKMIAQYRNIVEKYNLGQKEVELTCFPFESYPEEQLLAKVNRYDLVLTSPPYFNKELYEGDRSSHQLYSTYSAWASSFLAKSIHNSYRMTKENGYIVLCIANIKMHRNEFAMIVDDTQSEMQRYCSSVTKVLYGNPSFIRNAITPEVFVIGKVQKQPDLLYQPSSPSHFHLTRIGNTKKNKSLKVSKVKNGFMQFDELLKNNFKTCQLIYKTEFKIKITKNFTPCDSKTLFALLHSMLELKSGDDVFTAIKTGEDPLLQTPILLNASALYKDIEDYKPLIIKKLLAFVLTTPLNNHHNADAIKEFTSKVHQYVKKQKIEVAKAKHQKKLDEEIVKPLTSRMGLFAKKRKLKENYQTTAEFTASDTSNLYLEETKSMLSTVLSFPLNESSEQPTLPEGIQSKRPRLKQDIESLHIGRPFRSKTSPLRQYSSFLATTTEQTEMMEVDEESIIKQVI